MNKKQNVTNNIKEYMNSMGTKQFSYHEVSAMANAVSTEYNDRKEKKLTIKVKTTKGKRQLNERIATISNKKLNSKRITPEDVLLYKRCKAEEYQDRTGRCAFGYKEVRTRLGYDPNTGLEIID